MTNETEKIQEWDTKSGEVLFGLVAGHSNVVPSTCYSPDGRWDISGSHDTTIWLPDATIVDLSWLVQKTHRTRYLSSFLH